MTRYDPGDTVKFQLSVLDTSGAAYDPAVVKFHTQSPNGTSTTKIYGTDSEVTRLSQGVYQLVLYIPYSPASVGVWTCDAQGLDGSANSLIVEVVQFAVIYDYAFG